MTASRQETKLKALLAERHWTYSAFCREYDRTAGVSAPELTGTAPSRAQLHRWMSGKLKGLPYPDHCHILEKMFPGWTVAQLFEPAEVHDPAGRSIDALVQTMSSVFATSTAAHHGWGTLAARPSASGALGTAVVMAKRLVSAAHVLRLDDVETAQLAGLAGYVVDLGHTIDIVLDAAGAARVSHRHELFNMTDTPLSAFTREFWFQHTDGPLVVDTALPRLIIAPMHDAGNMVKFECHVAPPIKPGEIATVGYSCTGGMLGPEYFWRQEIRRHTRHLTITVHHGGVSRFTGCSAVEHHSDGTHEVVAETLLSDHDADGAVSITFTRDYLSPGQALTLRWDPT